VTAPRLASWLLARRLSSDWREFVLGDLHEEFAERARRSPFHARLWFWRQAIRCLAFPPASRRPTGLPMPGRGDSLMRTVLADLRYAVLVIARTPSFSVAVITVLALGIGANAAIFSIVNAVLLRPLPYPAPDRLVRLFHHPPQAAFPNTPTFSVSAANFYDWQRAATSFDRMALYRMRQLTLTGSGEPRAIMAGAGGPGFFDSIGSRPMLGRTFRPDEDTPATSHVVIVSENFWKHQLGGARDIVGRTLTFDGQAYTIVGVMPARESVAAWYVMGRDVWVPLALTGEDRNVRDNHNLQVIARLGPGSDLSRAQSELDMISQRLEHEYLQANAGWGAVIIPLQEQLVGDARPSLLILLGAVTLVLLIACANVGNLLFARTLARQKEIAIRSALGAGRRRVFQQLLIEALVLATAGGAAGLLLASVTLSSASALLGAQVPRADEISMDGHVLLFVVLISTLTGVLAGALPAIRGGRPDLNEALKEGGRGGAGIGLRTRRLLIVCEVALSVVLLMGAGVMLRTLVALRTADAGFNPDNLLTMDINLPDARYPTPASRMAFFDAALTRFRALPGVQSAGAIDSLPFVGGSVQPVVLEGKAELLPRDQPTVEIRQITPGYIRTMGIPLLRGRDVSASDENVLLVSRGAAALLWKDQDPIGRRATTPLMSKGLQRSVVGIVGDVKQGDPAAPPAPTIYYYSREGPVFGLTLVMRTSVPPQSVGQAALAAIRAIDPEQPVDNLKTMVEVRDEGLTSQRFSAWLLGLFAVVALVLASVGIYSVLSYIVRGRSREIGIRTALGAATSDVLRLVIVEGMSPTLVGIAVGTIAALAAARVMRGLVYGVSATDPLTLAAVGAILAVVALAASAIPAYRASRFDPVVVLRAE